MSQASTRIAILAASAAMAGLIAVGTPAGAAPVPSAPSTPAAASTATVVDPDISIAPGLLCLPILGNPIYGGPGDDYLLGTASRDIIYGYGGNDIIDGAGGNDVIFGGDDNDQMWGGTGNDCIRGGTGYDESWRWSFVQNGTDDVVAEGKYEY